MKEFFKTNVEKVVLIVMMLVLAVMAVSVIVSVDLADIELVKLKGSVRLDDVKQEIKVEQQYVTGEVSALFHNEDYIVCRKKSCESIFHGEFKKCPWCGTQVKTDTGPLKTNDSDGDGIPDDKEAEHNMDPNDPADALQDRDGDKFTNYDEIMVGVFGNPTLIDDASDYPSLLNFTVAKKKVAKPLPFIFKASNLGGGDKRSWEIQFLSSARSTRWLTIGAKIFKTDYYVADIEKSEAGVIVSVKREGGEVVVLTKLKRAFPANSKGVNVFDKRLAKMHFIPDGSVGVLTAGDKQLEEFEFRGFRKSESGKGVKVVLFSRKTNEEFEIDDKKSILNPVK